MRVDIPAVQEDLRKAGLVLLAAVIIEHFIKGAGFNLTVATTGAVMWIAGVVRISQEEEKS